MDNLEFVRIDDRLIHGQVVAAWLHAYSKVSYILVVDDKVSQDTFMLDMFKMLVPTGITIDIKSVDDAVKTLKEGLKKPTMMILKEPMTLKRIMDQGIQFPKINIGGMGMTAGRKKLFQNVSASEEEREIFREIIKNGTTVEVQIIPAAKAVNVASLIK
jgi:PTS system mannose-specific IIB component